MYESDALKKGKKFSYDQTKKKESKKEKSQFSSLGEQATIFHKANVQV